MYCALHAILINVSYSTSFKYVYTYHFWLVHYQCFTFQFPSYIRFILILWVVVLTHPYTLKIKFWNIKIISSDLLDQGTHTYQISHFGTPKSMSVVVGSTTANCTLSEQKGGCFSVANWGDPYAPRCTTHKDSHLGVLYPSAHLLNRLKQERTVSSTRLQIRWRLSHTFSKMFCFLENSTRAY